MARPLRDLRGGAHSRAAWAAAGPSNASTVAPAEPTTSRSRPYARLVAVCQQEVGGEDHGGCASAVEGLCSEA